MRPMHLLVALGNRLVARGFLLAQTRQQVRLLRKTRPEGTGEEARDDDRLKADKNRNGEIVSVQPGADFIDTCQDEFGHEHRRNRTEA